MSIDPRLMERRKTVAEDKAKKNVSRLLKFLFVVVMAGAVVWLIFSPWLSVSMVTTSGIVTSDGHGILAERRVVAGTPMILIGGPRVEEALLADPWIAEATVRLDWPHEVVVEIVEREPVAWALTEQGWARRAADGVALPSAEEPDDEMARIEMPDLDDAGAEASVELLGALEFVAALPPRLHQGTVVSLRDGELWARVSGYEVRLGRAVDMGEKALSLHALLDVGIPEGSTLNLIAPTNPSYAAPDGADRTVVGEGEEGSEDPDEGGGDDGNEDDGDS